MYEQSSVEKIKKYGSSLFTLLILIGGLVLTTKLSQEKQDIRQQASEKTGQINLGQSYEELIKSNKIKPAGKILEINLDYDEEKTPPVTITSIKKKNGYAPKYKNEGDYKLEITDLNNKSIYSLNFNIPKTLLDPPPLTKEDPVGKPIILKKTSFSLTIPIPEELFKLKIVDPKNNKLDTKSYTDIEEVNNKPNFQTIEGKILDTTSDKNQSSVTSTTDNQYLDIAFIGHGYTPEQLNIFHSDVNRFANSLTTYEPYKSRSSQIRFNYADNINDLGCYYDGRCIICNQSKVYEELNNKGVPYDSVYVIVNNYTYGGCAYLDSNMAFGYNGQENGKEVFVHELGHSFGGLWDEYSYSNNPEFDNLTHRNCYAGNPPANSWHNIVALKDYSLGCTHPNWYRSSYSSLMIRLDSKYFNTVSQNLLNQNLDFFAGQFTDTVPPVVEIIEPKNNAIISQGNWIYIKSLLSDNNGVSRVEFWKDGELFQTEYQEPFWSLWIIGNETIGNHTIQLKAFDTKGNSGSSSVFNITISKLPPIPSQTPTPTNTPTPTPSPTPTFTPKPTPDATPPKVTITNPLNNQLVAPNTITIIEATARDNVKVSKVEFRVNGVLKCTDNAFPYRCKWLSPSKSLSLYQSITAKAYDTSGLFSSHNIKVRIGQRSPQPQ